MKIVIIMEKECKLRTQNTKILLLPKLYKNGKISQKELISKFTRAAVGIATKPTIQNSDSFVFEKIIV